MWSLFKRSSQGWIRVRESAFPYTQAERFFRRDLIEGIFCPFTTELRRCYRYGADRFAVELEPFGWSPGSGESLLRGLNYGNFLTLNVPGNPIVKWDEVRSLKIQQDVVGVLMYYRQRKLGLYLPCG